MRPAAATLCNAIMVSFSEAAGSRLPTKCFLLVVALIMVSLHSKGTIIKRAASLNKQYVKKIFKYQSGGATKMAHE